MKPKFNYPKEQIKKAIEILEAMLEDNAPELSYEFKLYYEYMNQCSSNRMKEEEALYNFQSAMNKVVDR